MIAHPVVVEVLSQMPDDLLVYARNARAGRRRDRWLARRTGLPVMWVDLLAERERRGMIGTPGVDPEKAPQESTGAILSDSDARDVSVDVDGAVGAQEPSREPHG